MIRIKLKEYLSQFNITIQFLHETTGIRYATLFDIVHGNRNSINLKHLDKIMKALNVKDMNLLLEKDDNVA